MNDTNKVSQYYDEVVERASENYDPYWYLCDSEQDVDTEQDMLETFDWQYEG